MTGMLAILVALRAGAGTTGTVSGVVKDAGSGAVLSGANVMIAGTSLTTVTDASGKFIITNVPPGEYEIRAEMVGYGTQKAEAVTVTMDTVADVKFDLKQEAIQESAVVVTRPRPMIDTRIPNTLDLITAQQEPLTRTDPASLRQAGGLLGTLPGVLPEFDGSGQMYVRGGRSDETGWYIEGIPVTDPNTGQFGTNIFTTGINKFQVYTGGFGAEYGNAISGVFNEVKKTGATSPGFGSTFEDGNSAYRSAFAEYGGGTAGTFNYYGASSLMKTDLNGPVVKQFDYSDSIVKMVWPSASNSVTLLALQGKQVGDLSEQHTSGIRGETVPQAIDAMHSGYAVVGLSLNHSFGPKSFAILQPYYGFTATDGNAQGGSLGGAPQAWDARSVRYGLQVKYANDLNANNSLKLGGSLLKSSNHYYRNLTYAGVEMTTNMPTTQTDLYAENQMKLSEKWTATTGLRYESMNYDRQGGSYVPGSGYTGPPVPDATASYISPRLGVVYAASDRSAWKADWGLYTKFLPASVVQFQYADPSTEAFMSGLGSTSAQRSDLLELGYEQQASDSVMWRVTAFRNNYDNLSEMADIGGGVQQWTNFGTGKSDGLEFYTRKKMSDKWQAWFSYTYAKAQYDNAGVDTFTSWDQRNTACLVADHKVGAWSHSLRLDIGSGREGQAGAPRAKPYFISSYTARLALPGGSRLGDSLDLNIYNLFNSGQTMQNSLDGGGNPERYSWVTPRFWSLGLSRAL